MARRTLKINRSERTVWSNSNAGYAFFPTTGALESAGIKMGRPSFGMDRTTGELEIRPALQYSADGITWDGAVNIGTSTRTTDGETHDNGYVDLTALGTRKRRVRFGLNCKRSTAGSDAELCDGWIEVDLEE